MRPRQGWEHSQLRGPSACPPHAPSLPEAPAATPEKVRPRALARSRSLGEGPAQREGARPHALHAVPASQLRPGPRGPRPCTADPVQLICKPWLFPEAATAAHSFLLRELPGQLERGPRLRGAGWWERGDTARSPSSSRAPAAAALPESRTRRPGATGTSPAVGE